MTKKKSTKKKADEKDFEQLSLDEAVETTDEHPVTSPQEMLDEGIEQEGTAEVVGEVEVEAIDAEAALLEDEEAKESLPPSIEELQAELAGLKKEVDRLQNESEEYLDGWQRSRAEFANLKKRVEREKGEMRERITSEIISRYLDILDDFNRALKDKPTQETDESWADGIGIIHQKLKQILDSEGVETIEAEGAKFDPNLHEAISYEESDDHEDGQVIEVIKQGYMLGDRVIRPALVRVAK